MLTETRRPFGPWVSVTDPIGEPSTPDMAAVATAPMSDGTSSPLRQLTRTRVSRAVMMMAEKSWRFTAVMDSFLEMVGPDRLELSTSALSELRSCHLSYGPTAFALYSLRAGVDKG